MIVDTNIILRFFLGEADEKIVAMLEDDAVVITDMVISEAAYVLTGKMYNYSRSGVKAAILALIARDNVQYLTEADAEYLELYDETGLDLADCYLVRLAICQKMPLATLDKKMQQIYERELATVKL